MQFRLVDFNETVECAEIIKYFEWFWNHYQVFSFSTSYVFAYTRDDKYEHIKFTMTSLSANEWSIEGTVQ